MAALDRCPVVPVQSELLGKAVDVVHRIIHGNTDGDGRDGDGHHVEREPKIAHQSKYRERGDNIGDNGHTGHLQVAEEHHKHCQDGEEDKSQGEDL